MNLPKKEDLFDLSHTVAKSLFDGCEEVYYVITKIKEFIKQISGELGDDYSEISDGVFVARDSAISDFATVIGPTIIGHRTELRPGAYIRGSVIIGNDAVIGNSCEVKNSVIFDGVQIPHYNYVGDSILGYRVHLGAGAIVSNFRLDRENISIKTADSKIKTPLRKMGALIGDYCEVGCNAVICPGSIIGRKAVIYPLTNVNGIINVKSINESEVRSQI